MIAPPKSSNPLSPTQTLVDGRVPQKYSAARRYVLLLIFCLAQFLDAVNNSALFSAIPDLENSLGINEAQSTWVISAFQLTFASFLLIVSRVVLSFYPQAVDEWRVAERSHLRCVQPQGGVHRWRRRARCHLRRCGFCEAEDSHHHPSCVEWHCRRNDHPLRARAPRERVRRADGTSPRHWALRWLRGYRKW